MKNIIILFILPLFATAQIHVSPLYGQVFSFAKEINKGNNPSPYFRVVPYRSGFMGVNIGYTYNKFTFDLSWEYTEIGLQTYDNTLLILCADCKDSKSFVSNYGVPIHAFPLRIGYTIYSRKQIDIFAKLGYFQRRRYGAAAFAHDQTFGSYIRPNFGYFFPDGIPFTKVSRNLQLDLNMVRAIGAKKKYGLSLDLVFNLGLKKLSEDKFITQLYKTNETYTNYVTRRGNYISGSVGFIRIFQDSKKKVHNTRKKHEKIRYF
jgi:hypothetical protein